jgi:hypothetical protein
MSGKRYVSMPSQVADDLWHELILYTREYERFCARAFGSFLHHTPAVVLSARRKSNEGLRRVWWYCCKYENIDPVRPTRVPLLFALDSKANIPNGGGGCGRWRLRRWWRWTPILGYKRRTRLSS